MVLGFPWLSRHNPCIDWSRGSLTFASPFCSSSCLTPPPPSPTSPSHPPPSSPSPVLAATSLPSPSFPPTPVSPPDPLLFTQVPQAYHDYLDVFSEEQANTLPPHRKYDLEITLQPDTTPPLGSDLPYVSSGAG